MKHLIINSVGPITEADIQLRLLNVIIGPQSLGKSTVLKIASYCTWVEKRIELTQMPGFFNTDNNFISPLKTFHRMKDYFNEGSSIFYESDYLKFRYTYIDNKFDFEWKDGRWKYRRTKVTYIPAERNLVAVIPNWFEVRMERNNIWNFMSDWVTARNATTEQLQILNLNVAYQYDSERNRDVVSIQNGNTIDITDISSGLQSLIPLYVHLNYLCNGLYQTENTQRLAGKWENEDLLQIIYKELFENSGKTEAVHSVERENERGEIETTKIRYRKKIGSMSLLFTYPKYADECEDVYKQYLMTDHCEIFLEEPENNLFPPTQSRLIDWLYSMTTKEHKNVLFIATHSPYVLSVLLEKKSENVAMFYCAEQAGRVVVKSASDNDMQVIYDYGVDAFFNIENLSE